MTNQHVLSLFLETPQARADLLDQLVYCDSDDDSSDDCNPELTSPIHQLPFNGGLFCLSFSFRFPSLFAQLHFHFSPDRNGAVRFTDKQRPTINFGAIFHRFGDEEKHAVASFSFLDDEESSSDHERRHKQQMGALRSDFSPGRDLLGSSPTDMVPHHSQPHRTPIPPNPTVQMLKEENRKDMKEMRKLSMS